MNTFGKMIAFVFSMFVFFFLPVSYHANQQEALLQVYVQEQTEQFASQVRVRGYVDWTMYEGYVNALSDTGYLYTITMEHARVICEPKSSEDLNTDSGGTTIDALNEAPDYLEYTLSSYEDEIIGEMEDNEGGYEMSKGDSFYVEVSNRSDTYRDFFEQFFYGAKNQNGSIFASAGGQILDEKGL